jgi:hypothetical protein
MKFIITIESPYICVSIFRGVIEKDFSVCFHNKNVRQEKKQKGRVEVREREKDTLPDVYISLSACSHVCRRLLGARREIQEIEKRGLVSFVVLNICKTAGERREEEALQVLLYIFYVMHSCLIVAFSCFSLFP